MKDIILDLILIFGSFALGIVLVVAHYDVGNPESRFVIFMAIVMFCATFASILILADDLKSKMRRMKEGRNHEKNS